MRVSEIHVKRIRVNQGLGVYLKFKENNENDMAAQVFWAVFYANRQLIQIGPTADFNSAAIQW